MHFSYILPFVLGPLVHASNSHHRHGYGHGHNRRHAPGTVSSQELVASSVSGAPYPIGNSTGIVGSSGSVSSTSTTTILTTSTKTVVNTVFATSEAAQTEGSGDSGSLPVVKVASTCGGTVTVTEESSETITVTVGGGTTPDAESPSSSQAASESSPVKEITTTGGQGASAEVISSAVPTTASEVDTSPSPTLAAPSSTDTTTVSEIVRSTSPPSEAPSSTDEAAGKAPASDSDIGASSTVSPSTTLEATVETPVASPQPSASPALSATKVSSSAATPEETTSGSGDCTSKRGILATAGGPNHDQGNISLAFADEPKICWIANWYSAPPPAWNPAKQFVPQNYGPSSDEEEWHTNAKQAIAKGEKTFLSFGEPNAQGRDHLEPEQAVELYMRLMQPYAEQGVRICSPAVLQPRVDMDWLASFLTKCEAAGCTIGMICVHWFDTTSAATPGFPEFQRTVENATALARGKKVWVDNFQANGSPEDVRAFLDEALPYLEGNDNVERYAYVPPLRTDPSKSGSGFRTDQMISPDLGTNGTLTDLGRYYADF